MKSKDKPEERWRLKRVKVDYMDKITDIIHEGKEGWNGRILHRFINHLVDVAKPIFSYMTRDIITKNLLEKNETTLDTASPPPLIVEGITLAKKR